MFIPDYFLDRAKRWLELAKRIRDPELAERFAERAKLLKQTAMHAERGLALSNARENARVVASTAKTIAELRGELQNLRLGMSLKLSFKDFSPGQKDEVWRASPQLTQEFGCIGEFRPDGSLWFVKRLARHP